MASWNTKRQVAIGSVIGGIILLAIGIPVYFTFFNKKPTCFDGKQNQNELGIDCGGACAKICAFESKEPILIFERFFPIAPGTVSTLALIENANQGVFARKAIYQFKVYDKEGLLLEERIGETYIPPNKIFPIFEHSFFVGEGTPAKATFTFGYPIPWERGNYVEPELKIENQFSKVVDGKPLVEADIRNSEVYDVKDIVIVAIVYDKDGNAIGVSQTIVPKLRARSAERITFTWNEPFKTEAQKIELLPRAKPRNF